MTTYPPLASLIQATAKLKSRKPCSRTHIAASSPDGSQCFATVVNCTGLQNGSQIITSSSSYEIPAMILPQAVPQCRTSTSFAAYAVPHTRKLLAALPAATPSSDASSGLSFPPCAAHPNSNHPTAACESKGPLTKLTFHKPLCCPHWPLHFSSSSVSFRKAINRSISCLAFFGGAVGGQTGTWV